MGLNFFFFNDTATTEIYTLSLHDALPICDPHGQPPCAMTRCRCASVARAARSHRSEEHTSELQSQSNLVCRLLLEKKKHTTRNAASHTTTHSLTDARPVIRPRSTPTPARA